jgi:hypothetical protein
MKIRPVGTKLFHVDGQTDRQTEIDRRDEANSRFSQLCERAYKPVKRKKNSMCVWGGEAGEV